MSFEDDRNTRDPLTDLQKYERLVRKAGRVNDELEKWEENFAELRASVTPTKQAELDNKKTAFVNKLKDTLGL